MALRLWRLYGERVEDVTGHKVLHGPTDEVKVYTTIGDPSNAPYENLALCYAIYFTATVSLEKSETEQYLEDDRVTSLFNFKHGLEQAFAHGDFLDRPSITALFALSIYLVSSSFPLDDVPMLTSKIPVWSPCPASWSIPLDSERLGHPYSTISRVA